MPSQQERDWAMAVHSLDDETRVHTDADETGVVADAGGEIRPVPERERGHAEPAAPGGGDHETVSVQRELPVEPTIVRGTLQDLAQRGEWTGLTDHARNSVRLHVEDAGAGASLLTVTQEVQAGHRDAVTAALDAAIDDLEARLVSRTSDAS